MLSTPMPRQSPATMALPRISPPLVSLFTRYSRGYVRRHFHTVRVLKTHALPNSFHELPVAAFANHASWWDPLICLLLAAEYFPGRSSFAPIDARLDLPQRFAASVGLEPGVQVLGGIEA